MTYRTFADLIVVLHFAFVLFVIFGGLLVLRWPRVAWVHLPAAVWGVGIEVVQGLCPLTPLENSLRRLGGEAGYSGSFVEHYVLPVLYPADVDRSVQLALTFLVLLLNVTVYTVAWRRRVKRRT